MDNKTTKPSILNETDKSKFVEFDVRPIIKSGEDPFLQIMEKIKNLKKGEILVIINSFEPAPLYAVLGKKGFEHWTEFIDGVYRVHFFRTGKEEKESDESSVYIDESAYEKVVELDVRELGPPEPMIKIMEKLPEIDEKTILLVHHHREPLMLYPKLEERGYEAVAHKVEENYFKVIIRKK